MPAAPTAQLPAFQIIGRTFVAVLIAKTSVRGNTDRHWKSLEKLTYAISRPQQTIALSGLLCSSSTDTAVTAAEESAMPPPVAATGRGPHMVQHQHKTLPNKKTHTTAKLTLEIQTMFLLFQTI